MSITITGGTAAGNGTGIETRSGTGNGIGSGTGNETGSEIGNETGSGTGNENGTETGTRTGTDQLTKDCNVTTNELTVTIQLHSCEDDNEMICHVSYTAQDQDSTLEREELMQTRAVNCCQPAVFQLDFPGNYSVEVLKNSKTEAYNGSSICICSRNITAEATLHVSPASNTWSECSHTSTCSPTFTLDCLQLKGQWWCQCF